MEDYDGHAFDGSFKFIKDNKGLNKGGDLKKGEKMDVS
jgi:hypothetical protein